MAVHCAQPGIGHHRPSGVSRVSLYVLHFCLTPLSRCVLCATDGDDTDGYFGVQLGAETRVGILGEFVVSHLHGGMLDHSRPHTVDCPSVHNPCRCVSMWTRTSATYRRIERSTTLPTCIFLRWWKCSGSAPCARDGPEYIEVVGRWTNGK